LKMNCDYKINTLHKKQIEGKLLNNFERTIKKSNNKVKVN